MNGLDQDMMQRNLSCKNFRDSQKNMITSGILQFFVILLFLMLGVLLYTFTAQQGIINPDKSDELFPMIATGGYFPAIVGILFIIGLISSAYSAAGSALTALTTSFTVDILKAHKKEEAILSKIRKRVHIGMAIVMGLVIFVFNLVNSTSVIDAIYTLASYTYGPILGLFAFGIFTKKQVYDKYIPVVAILSPLLCYVLQRNSEAWFAGYQISYELLILNASFTFAGLCVLIRKEKKVGVSEPNKISEQ
ncbi:sodium/iodide co-transporter [Bacteroides reticulotermitis JCM 10512]|uniref:Sodium/iodide co-transporter n=2 Tax=Bacteroides reticulotermitis TaxID=1133319 RepID=W4UQD3_9BACE|nr:sodium/iodide co-transporter [Bacteroides reticulotermitis JCM 10512]